MIKCNFSFYNCTCNQKLILKKFCGEEIEVTVIGIESDAGLLDKAKEGEYIGLLLRGLSNERDVERCDVLINDSELYDKKYGYSDPYGILDIYENKEEPIRKEDLEKRLIALLKKYLIQRT